MLTYTDIDDKRSDGHFDDEGEPASARFALRDLDRPHADVRQVDGAWWPHSLALADEVGDLVVGAARAGFATQRIEFCGKSWESSPRRVNVDGNRVRLDGSAKQPTSLTLIGAFDWARLEIVVVPPQTPEDVAGHALRLASGGDGSQSSDQVLERAYADEPADPRTGSGD